jgi:type VI secretion system secreted protein VgrG
MAEQIRPGAFAASDYNFERPRTPLLATSRKPGQHLHGDRERFDYPGHYLIYEDGESRVRTRLEQRQADGRLVRSSGNVRGLGAGNLFSLTDFPRTDQNREHLVIGARYQMNAGRHGSSDAADDSPELAIELTLVDSQVTYRPPAQVTKPRMGGPQTAVVVGKKGEEIWTDKYGRVLVQFHWDRYGLSDQQSSCWVRVAQTAAGGRWGSVMVPRVGNEVMVDFLEGDPDRPIITGQVYNAANMPPYDLAVSPTQSGVRSRSAPGGNQQNFNEVTFEDKIGQEELRIQAEKDQTTNVKNQQTITVGGSRTLTVKQDETDTIEGSHTLTVTKTETETFLGPRTMTVAKDNTETVTGKETETYLGGRLTTVDKGDTLIVNGSDKTTTVHGACNVTADTLYKVQQGANSLLVQDQIKLDSVGEIQLVNGTCRLDLLAGVATLTADNEISFVCGAASISLKKDGTIDITGGKMVTATGSTAGLKLEQPGATMSGPTATISGGSLTEIKGDEIKFN